MGRDNTEIQDLMHPAFWRGNDKSRKELFSCTFFTDFPDITGPLTGSQAAPLQPACHGGMESRI